MLGEYVGSWGITRHWTNVELMCGEIRDYQHFCPTGEVAGQEYQNPRGNKAAQEEREELVLGMSTEHLMRSRNYALLQSNLGDYVSFELPNHV